jgi:adenylate cyclase class IV
MSDPRKPKFAETVDLKSSDDSYSKELTSYIELVRELRNGQKAISNAKMAYAEYLDLRKVDPPSEANNQKIQNTLVTFKRYANRVLISSDNLIDSYNQKGLVLPTDISKEIISILIVGIDLMGSFKLRPATDFIASFKAFAILYNDFLALAKKEQSGIDPNTLLFNPDEVKAVKEGQKRYLALHKNKDPEVINRYARAYAENIKEANLKSCLSWDKMAADIIYNPRFKMNLDTLTRFEFAFKQLGKIEACLTQLDPHFQDPVIQAREIYNYVQQVILLDKVKLVSYEKFKGIIAELKRISETQQQLPPSMVKQMKALLAKYANLDAKADAYQKALEEIANLRPESSPQHVPKVMSATPPPAETPKGAKTKSLLDKTSLFKSSIGVEERVLTKAIDKIIKEGVEGLAETLDPQLRVESPEPGAQVVPLIRVLLKLYKDDPKFAKLVPKMVPALMQISLLERGAALKDKDCYVELCKLRNLLYTKKPGHWTLQYQLDTEQSVAAGTDFNSALSLLIKAGELREDERLKSTQEGKLKYYLHDFLTDHFTELVNNLPYYPLETMQILIYVVKALATEVANNSALLPSQVPSQEQVGYLMLMAARLGDVEAKEWLDNNPQPSPKSGGR